MSRSSPEAKLGRAIRLLRLSKNITQEALAHAVGFSHKSAIYRLESGEAEYLNLKLLVRICNVLEISVIQLMMLADLDESPSQIRSWESFFEGTYHLPPKERKEMIKLVEEIFRINPNDFR